LKKGRSNTDGPTADDEIITENTEEPTSSKREGKKVDRSNSPSDIRPGSDNPSVEGAIDNSAGPSGSGIQYPSSSAPYGTESSRKISGMLTETTQHENEVEGSSDNDNDQSRPYGTHSSPSSSGTITPTNYKLNFDDSSPAHTAIIKGFLNANKALDDFINKTDGNLEALDPELKLEGHRLGAE
jgi:hypothetical protein